MLFYGKHKCRIVDMGREPLVVSLEDLAECNESFRASLWTGENLQCFLMDIPKMGSSDGGLLLDVEQFYFCVAGFGTVSVGDSPNRIGFQKALYEGYGVLIPSGCWFRLVNDGKKPLKLIAVVSSPQLPQGTLEENP